MWFDLRLLITPFVSSDLSWIFYMFIFDKKIEDVQLIKYSHTSFLPITNMLLTLWGEIEGLMSIQCLLSSTSTRKRQFKQISIINCFLFSIFIHNFFSLFVFFSFDHCIFCPLIYDLRLPLLVSSNFFGETIADITV